MNSKLDAAHKMYGTTSLGARGQLVIPAEARKDLHLKTGDKLIVMGKFGKALGLIPAEAMGEVVSLLMEHIADKDLRVKLKKHAKQLTEEFIKH